MFLLHSGHQNAIQPTLEEYFRFGACPKSAVYTFTLHRIATEFGLVLIKMKPQNKFCDCLFFKPIYLCAFNPRNHFEVAENKANFPGNLMPEMFSEDYVRSTFHNSAVFDADGQCDDTQI